MKETQKEQFFLKSWPGFTVYDADTGENLSDTQLYLLDPEGQLVKPVYTGTSLVLTRPAKKGKFLIQFGDSAKILRW